jgi:hypothetical protein
VILRPIPCGPQISRIGTHGRHDAVPCRSVLSPGPASEVTEYMPLHSVRARVGQGMRIEGGRDSLKRLIFFVPFPFFDL